MKPNVRYVSVSEMQDFLNCQWRWYAKWVLNRQPRRWSEALILGTAVHDVLEDFFRGRPMIDAYADGLARLNTKWIDPEKAYAYAKARKQYVAFEPQITGFKLRYPIEEVRSIEEPFELNGYEPRPAAGWPGLPTKYVLRGRPDLVVVVGGLLYHVQHKTVAIGKPVDTYSRILQRSMHEGLYGYYLAGEHPERYGGTIVNMIRKGVVGPKHPLESLGFQTMLTVDAIDRQRAYLRATVILREMDRALYTATTQGHGALLDNPGQDGGPFGNSLDGYLPVLQGRASLDDDSLFMDREETYAQ